MENIETQQSEDGNESVNASVSIMGPEHSGRLRLYGRGVTKTTLKGKVGYFDGREDDKIGGVTKTTLKGKVGHFDGREDGNESINDLLQKMEERMIRLEEKFQEQKEQFEEQKAMTRQDIVEDVITKLQHSGVPFDANVLAILGEASSTRAAAIQPIHHPSIGSNNQGEKNEQSGDKRSEYLT
ncbi:hypothetical protein RND71_037118 [Anisodus tanguticus]|uniref:Uncharacterized protein n=1 Tax=Anisodus tanguticus TaxID=243964 RepID=A0AAE1R1Q3_9SOLA|nr:hypothetical protein RND71_037118 [Anisodus tanguticus]